jgi:hypothetical protein
MPDELIDDRTFAGVVHRLSRVFMFDCRSQQLWRCKYERLLAILHDIIWQLVTIEKNC